MPALLEDVRNQIEALCRQHHVRRLEVFGSTVRDDFDAERSDVDFLVEFEDDPSIDLFGAYMGLREALSDVLAHPVDLVMMSAVRNPYVRADIEAHRQVFYAA
jgi:predicted nucleotidyltransferase